MEVNSFLQEMRKDRADKIKSVMYFFKNADDIQKGIASDLSYNEDFSKIDKKGSEIKEKLVSYKQEVISMISDYSSKQGELKTKIGQEPSAERDYMGYGYKAYPYQNIYDNEGTSQESSDMKRQFNEISLKICELKKELNLTDTYIGNIKVDKMYKLPVRVASVLGF